MLRGMSPAGINVLPAGNMQRYGALCACVVLPMAFRMLAAVGAVVRRSALAWSENITVETAKPTPAAFAVIPAAGRSRRMGTPKLLLPWRGATVLEAVIRAWQASRVSEIVVVAHPEDQQLHKLVVSTEADLLVADPPPADMKASVAAGLKRIEERFDPRWHDVWLVAPADMPQLSPAVIDKLLASHDRHHPSILIPVHRTKRGHPALFPWPLALELKDLPVDEGVNGLQNRHPVRTVACSPAALSPDIDTPEDYRRLRNRP